MTPATPPQVEKNAAGPFDSTGGCTACGEAEAPDLLATLTDDRLDTALHS